MLPKVSIIIPAYNASNYLVSAIDSAVAQTYSNIEIIVINDGSTDGGATESIARSYGNKIRYFFKHNGGVASALNLGIEKMTGEYFSWLSHDDVYYPNKIQTQIDYLTMHNINEDVVLFANWDMIDANSNKVGSVVSDHQLLVQKPFYSLLRSRIHGCTLLIPRALFFKIDKFNEKLRTTQDYDLWFKMMLNGVKFVHLPQTLIKSRQHAEQDTHKNPQTLIEANGLWSKFALEMPHDYMIQLEGSVEKFYSELSNFLFTTPYTYAANFVRALELVNILKNILSKHPIRLIFSHLYGGGSEFFLQDHLLDKNLVILVRSIGGSCENNVEIINNKIITNKYTFTQLTGLLDALQLIDITDVHINHVINLDNLNESLHSITQYITDKKVPAFFYLHDYFSLCPTINLINNKNQYCGLPTDEEVCNQCLLTNKLFLNYALPYDVGIRKWREPFFQLLNACAKVFVFSDSSRKLLLKCYPQLERQVFQYKLSQHLPPEIINPINFSHKHTINIGALGVIAPTKGLWKLQELSIFIQALNLPMRLTIIGITTEEINNAVISGAYAREDLTKVVTSYDIDLFVLPSICPETYCYTVDEIMHMGYPVICFDVGAPPERVVKYEHGYIVSEITAYSLLKKIIEVAASYGFKGVTSLNEDVLINKLINFMNNINREHVTLIQSIKGKVKEETQELELVSYELQTVYNSTIWRLTKPVRLILDKLKSIFC